MADDSTSAAPEAPTDSAHPDRRAKGVFIQTAELTAAAISFDKILVGGLLSILAMILILVFLLAKKFGATDQDLISDVISIFKDIALILVGALANSVRHKLQEKPGEDTSEN